MKLKFVLATHKRADHAPAVPLPVPGYDWPTYRKDNARTVLAEHTVPATGKELCRLYSFDAGKDWLVVTPEGSFDGSPGAWRFVAYRVPGTLKLLDDDATRRRGYRPGLLAQVWKGDK